MNNSHFIVRRCRCGTFPCHGGITSNFNVKVWLVQCSRLAERWESETTSMGLLLPYRHVLISSFFSPFTIKLSSYNILRVSILSLIVVRWCHLDIKVETSCIHPAVLYVGWPVGRGKFSTGMDSQQRVYLYLITWQLQGRESWVSTISSWCLISHSFSYWIFLFKAAL